MHVNICLVDLILLPNSSYPFRSKTFVCIFFIFNGLQRSHKMLLSKTYLAHSDSFPLARLN